MEPRLKTSKQWTKMPAELLDQMGSVFENGFKSQLGKAEVRIEGRIYPGELLLSVGFSRANQLKQPNFDVSIAFDVKKDNVLKTIHVMFDAMGALFDTYFSSADDSEFPLIWEPLDFEGKKLFVQYSTRNTTLESDADALLGKDDALLNEDGDDLDVEILKEKLGLADDEGEEH
jgi:hypothetical protein